MASYKTHTVVRGETLSHIALKYGTTVGYLAKLNNIRNVHRIYVGQVLKISEIVKVSPSKPNPTPAPAPQPSRPSNPAPVSNNTKVTLKSTTVTITAFGLQADTDRTFFATWDWDGPYTDRFEVRWFYRTENNVKFTGYSGSVSPTDNSQAQSTYNAPTNATHIYFQVKPIAQTHKVNNSDVAWWTANWSTEKVYNMSDLPPAKPSNPKVTLEDYTLKVEVTGVPEDVTGVEFQIIQNDTKVYMVGSSSNLTSTAKFSCSVDPGYDYKARCRAVKNGLYSEWTDYSSNVQTKPSKPDKINEIRALSGTSLTLNWSESTNAETYELEYATKLEYLGMSNASTTINGITGPRYIITGLGSGEKYFIRVRAANAQGKSDWTEAVSIILGSIPAAPTTWSSTTTAIVGEDMKLYWMHNSKDGSKETIAEIECIINNEAPTTVQVIKTNISDDVSYYNLITRTLTEGATIRWKVRTAGVTGEYGPWSATRVISIYAPPALALTIREDSAYGSVINEITRFPFYIVAGTGPASQKPLGYHLSVISRDSYETVDNLGNVKMVSAGQEIMSKFYDINEHTLTVKVTPGDIDLENNCRYYLQCTVTMDSGLTKEEKIAFEASFVETEYFPTAEILFNRDTLSTHIRPYCTERHFNFYEVESTAGEASYTGTDIKATNTIEAPLKSAILYGQTLVNLLNRIATTATTQYSDVASVKNGALKPSTKYLLKIKNNTNEEKRYYSAELTEWELFIIPQNSEFAKVITTKSVLPTRHIILQNHIKHSVENDIQIVFIEYQDDMENWDIPYFTGMQSVKMPVLSTTGKNLLNMHDYKLRFATTFVGSTNDSITFTTTEAWGGIFYDFYLKPSQTYYVSFDSPQTSSELKCFVRLLNTSSSTIGGSKSYSFTTDSTGKVRFSFETTSALENATVSNVQIEEGTQASPYEPHKSNILSTPSDLELRGIGDVQDTLDLLTGEVVENTIKYLFNGNENWKMSTQSPSNTDVLRFSTNLIDALPPAGNTDELVQKTIMCDKFIVENGYDRNKECVFINNEKTFSIYISKTKCSDLQTFKTWLSNNNVTILAKKSEKVHKTVDLSIVDQDNSPVNWMSTFKDTTHISSSSDTTNSLVGELDVVVKTKDALVSYNRTEIKIDPLEGTSIDGAITTEGDLVFVGVNSKGQVIYFTVKESTREYLVENVTLSVYRQDYDGRFVTIATDIENLSSIYVTDPHPPLNYANYRIVVTDKITGGISYVDIPPYEIGVKSVIIQWGEKWENLTVLGQDPVEQVEWAGSMLKLPYNIDVSDSNTMDVSLVEYIGRAHPVSYYGTQLGVSSTWNVEIPKYDTSTLYGLRLLAIYTGDVYVREPSGSGYWANISVSFSQKHKELTIPITLNIKRVDGDV